MFDLKSDSFFKSFRANEDNSKLKENHNTTPMTTHMAQT